MDGKNIKENTAVNKNEAELISLIRESDDPQQVATFMLNLFLDYLHTSVPSEETPSAVLRESA